MLRGVREMAGKAGGGWRWVAVLTTAWCLSTGGVEAAEPAQSAAEPKTIVLIAGTKSHGPGHHEYEKGARLLKACLDAAPDLPEIRTEVCLDGWPEDESLLDRADTIFLFCDGSDRDEQAHPLLRGERLARMQKLMDKGVGLVAIHYTVFVPSERGGQQFLDWIGGYFDYENGTAPNRWFSKIGVHSTKARPNADHPIARGIQPFQLEEEYYYNIRFRDNDEALTPILSTPIPGEPAEQVVAWAVERADGGRGFGFTGGHFHANWGVDEFRKMVLNALVWTAKIEVPREGVASRVSKVDLTVQPPEGGDDAAAPIKTLILTGHNHPAHDWRATTKALEEVLRRDRRFDVSMVVDPEVLAQEALADYDLIVQNYVNWERPGISDVSKAALLKFVEGGKGLVVVHFANGAFTQWPEYRKLSRRVWVEGTSSHDAYGGFRVQFTERRHPITEGMRDYETTDELYNNQQGELPIEPLATARSKDTGRDEPMAFAYEYGQGRVFQTVLGHDARAIRNEGTAELMRRGSAWAAGRDPVGPGGSAAAAAESGEPAMLAEGKFGRGLAGGSPVAAAGNEVYQGPPITVECWARLRSKGGFNILVANSAKESSNHWEVYTYAGSGALSAYLPGYRPAEIVSSQDITDDAWHYVAMVYEPRRVRLYVDGRQVADERVEPLAENRHVGPLYFASYPPHSIGCDGVVDEVRVSDVAREVTEAPRGRFEADEHTVGLWHLDDAGLADASRLGNAAGVRLPGLEESGYRASDEGLKVVFLDRSAGESLLSLRADSEGRLFAGGREALFVYEPAAAGGYTARRELYRFPPHSWITDIEIRGDDLYVMTASAIYLFENARTARRAAAPRKLIWGLPLDLHVTMHGLAFGPQGDLYFSTGDPLLNYGDFERADHWGHWTLYSQPEGMETGYTGAGGVFRCRPDGSGLEMVARGLRGSDGLAFDRRWNLFTNDNDHESLAARYSPARLLHVTPHADFHWPRGWMPSITPERAELLEPVYSGMSRGVPVAQAYYDDLHLPAEYRDNLLVARWDLRAVTRYPLRPRGASLAADEHQVISGHGDARPVGVAVGRGGRVFAAISYMAQNEGSPTYPSDLVMLTRDGDAETYPFEAYDVTRLDEKALWAELSRAEWSRRLAAHQELLRRGPAVLDAADQRLEALGGEDPAWGHLPWLVAASGSEHASGVLSRLVEDPRPEVRLQATGALIELWARSDRGGMESSQSDQAARRAVVERALADASPPVRLAALAGCWYLDGPPPEAVEKAARARDTYLRQTATTLLAERAEMDQLETLCQASDVEGRLAGVLAAGCRLTVPPAMGPLSDELELKYFHQNALFEIDYADGRVDLRAGHRVGSFTIAEYWKTMPHSAEEERLFALLVGMLQDPAESVRLQAVHFLHLLNDPRSEALLRPARLRGTLERLAPVLSRPIEPAWVIGPLSPRWLAEVSASDAAPFEGRPIDLAASHATGQGVVEWVQTAGSDGRYAMDMLRAAPPDDMGVYYLYCRLETADPETVLLEVESEAMVRVWHNGRPVDQGPMVLRLEPGSNDLLVRLDAAGEAAAVSLGYRASGRVSAVLPEKLAGGSLAERLKNVSSDSAEAIAAEFLEIDWATAAGRGDAGRGRRLFGGDALGCVKCHAISPLQAGGGAPSLADARRRFTVPHLVESILAPSKQVAPLFRATSIETDDGLALSGLVVRETQTELELLLSDATRKTLDKQRIEARELKELSPMPAGVVKTPQELADLLAYLLSENPVAP